MSKLHIEDIVSIGDWCAFRSEDKGVAVGRIEAFRYMSGTTWENQEYSDMSAPTEPPAKTARSLGGLCTWYKINQTKELVPTSMDVHGYYDVSHYLYTLPKPSIQVRSNKYFFVLPVSERDISIF